MKGQGSTEYLVVFAAVLVIALIVIFLLGQFSGFSQKSLADQSKSSWAQMVPVAVEDFGPVGNGSTNVTLKLKNLDVKKLYIRDVLFDGTSATASTPTFGNAAKLNPGQDKEFEVQFGTVCDSGDSGQMVEYDMQINYSYKAGGTQFTEVGSTPIRILCP
ncbi:MAG: class III signal peptide-containing protein [Methanobacteriota archaeon]|nr:MAG: class III signal peptide-containing protein [Euryarchaeota archaeon]